MNIAILEYVMSCFCFVIYKTVYKYGNTSIDFLIEL